MEHQQTVTVILVLVLNVIAWIAGWLKGHNNGQSFAINNIMDTLLSMGVSVEDCKKVLDKSIERIVGKQKTPTDSQ